MLQKIDSMGDFVSVSLSDTECQIVGYTGDENARVIDVPSIYNGKRVISVGFLDKSAIRNAEIINLPSCIEEIIDKAFENCPSLRRVSFPFSVRKIGRDSFRGCPRLDDETKARINAVSISTDYGSPKEQYDKTGWKEWNRGYKDSHGRDSSSYYESKEARDYDYLCYLFRTCKVIFFGGMVDNVRRKYPVRIFSTMSGDVPCYVTKTPPKKVYIHKNTIPKEDGIEGFCDIYGIRDYEVKSFSELPKHITKEKKKTKKYNPSNAFHIDRSLPGARAKVRLFH